jgi:hypothetical protein
VPLLKVSLDSETYARLTDQASSERRPIQWQAEVVLRRGLGLPFPLQQHAQEADSQRLVESTESPVA